MEKIKKTVLKNGLRIITIPMIESLTTTVLVLVEAGSKYETKDINGISHFLEHMCFKGTKKRPQSIDISSELDNIGAQYNAFTSMEYTGYFAKARPEHFDIILDVVSDMYLNPTFKQKEINKERGVIIEEINMYEDLPMRNVQDIFTNLLYGDQPAGWSIAGRKEVVKKINRADFIKYRNQHYLGQSSLVVVAGKFKENEVIKKIEKAFNSIKSSLKTPKIKTVESQKKPEVLLKYKKTDQAHLVLGVRAFDIFDSRRFALDILAVILGQGFSSRLVQKIREEMGAAYYINADSEFLTDHGFFTVSAGVDNNKIKKVIKAILKEFKKITKELVKNKELQRAKEQLIAKLAIGLETSDQLAGFYGGQEIVTGEPLSSDEIIQKIRDVKNKEIKDIALEIFKNNKLNLAVIGPFKEKKIFEKILRF
ncbi:insulinase family protein [Candidatus Wolfebacteria bacterium]|nr:insulinase family protein [Candidatus Wolfebacteria bacterium]